MHLPLPSTSFLSTSSSSNFLHPSSFASHPLFHYPSLIVISPSLISSSLTIFPFLLHLPLPLHPPFFALHSYSILSFRFLFIHFPLPHFLSIHSVPFLHKPLRLSLFSSSFTLSSPSTSPYRPRFSPSVLRFSHFLFHYPLFPFSFFHRLSFLPLHPFSLPSFFPFVHPLTSPSFPSFSSTLFLSLLFVISPLFSPPNNFFLLFLFVYSPQLLLSLRPFSLLFSLSPFAFPLSSLLPLPPRSPSPFHSFSSFCPFLCQLSLFPFSLFLLVILHSSPSPSSPSLSLFPLLLPPYPLPLCLSSPSLLSLGSSFSLPTVPLSLACPSHFSFSLSSFFLFFVLHLFLFPLSLHLSSLLLSSFLISSLSLFAIPLLIYLSLSPPSSSSPTSPSFFFALPLSLSPPSPSSLAHSPPSLSIYLSLFARPLSSSPPSLLLSSLSSASCIGEDKGQRVLLP
ncbi:hypothetical protein C7M84_009505 [Penaeus vannamei]|uniref:Uncharacterized protein n=1 Tax=Penaeus vannamei TaxID=6689 RepID=A0A423T6Q2_PENVA|nr:hypothetical protein C7M84_009505 [Penaeus vannamei]